MVYHLCISTTECIVTTHGMGRCDALSCIRRIRFLLRIRVKKAGQGFDPWPDPTRTQIADPVTRWPVTRISGSISAAQYIGFRSFDATHVSIKVSKPSCLSFNIALSSGKTLSGGATLCNKMSKFAHYGHVYHTLTLTCAKNLVIIFGSFLDIRENAEWPRFLTYLVLP